MFPNPKVGTDALVADDPNRPVVVGDRCAVGLFCNTLLNPLKTNADPGCGGVAKLGVTDAVIGAPRLACARLNCRAE